MNATTVSFATELLLDILLGSFALMSITGLVCTIQSAIYDHRREKRDLEYHERRMKEFKKSTAVGGGSDPAALYSYVR